MHSHLSKELRDKYTKRSIRVKKGDKVKTKQNIGEAFTNPSNGKTILNFSVLKETTTQNPAEWCYKM